LASFRNTASSRKPVLLISYYYPPDTQSGAARPHRFAKYLRRLGHPVTILAAGPETDPVTDGDVHRLRGGGIRYPRQDTAAFIERCFRQTLFVHDPGGTWAWRVADYAARWIRNAAEQPVVISTAPPATCHAAGYLLKKRHGVRWIADFRDPMTGNPFRPGRMASFFDRPLERRFFEAADVIIANTDAVEKMWVQRRPDLKHKFHVIWNGFDPEEPLASQPLPPRPQRVLAHIGVIYGDRDPNLLLRSFARLVQSGRVNPASVRLELTGSIDFNLLDAEATQALKERGSFESRESVPRAEAQRLMATADYLLLLDVISDKAGLQVPAKIFEYVRIGRPVIACTTSGSPVDRILAQSGLSYTALYPDLPPEQTDERLLRALESNSDPRPPSAWFCENFDARGQAETLSRMIG
jgi:glycosyltransferase involved in cell wall biosynthesis